MITQPWLQNLVKTGLVDREVLASVRLVDGEGFHRSVIPAGSAWMPLPEHPAQDRIVHPPRHHEAVQAQRRFRRLVGRIGDDMDFAFAAVILDGHRIKLRTSVHLVNKTAKILTNHSEVVEITVVT